MPATKYMFDSHADEMDRESQISAAHESHAALPEKAANKKREENRFKLVEGDSQPK